MQDYVAVYIRITEEKEEYLFQSPNDDEAVKAAIRHHVDKYYVKNISCSSLNPGKNRLIPVEPCERLRIVGTLDKLFLDEEGKRTRIMIN